MKCNHRAAASAAASTVWRQTARSGGKSPAQSRGNGSRSFRKCLGCLVAGGSLGLAVMLTPLLAPAESPDAAIEIPSPPRGYDTPDEVKAAIVAGKIKLISQPKELPAGVSEQRSIEYCKVGAHSLKLDLYLPEKITKPIPLLVFIHGGGWVGGSRDIYKYYTVRYAQRGYAAATISYRFSGEAPFPAAVQDVKCAVRWLRAHAAQYQIDPDKIAALGASAGGHLALMLGYSAKKPEFDQSGGDQTVSSRVQAVVDFYGPSDLTTEFAKAAGPVKKFMGDKTFSEAPELYRSASPMTYLDKTCPPTLVFHGTIDDVVPVEQSDRLVARLKELGVPCVYDRIPGWPHTMDLAEVVNEHCLGVMDRFLAKYLPLSGPTP